MNNIKWRKLTTQDVLMNGDIYVHYHYNGGIILDMNTCHMYFTGCFILNKTSRSIGNAINLENVGYYWRLEILEPELTHSIIKNE